MPCVRPSQPPPVAVVAAPARAKTLGLGSSRTAAAFRAGDLPRGLSPARREARSVGAANLKAATGRTSIGEVAEWFGATSDRVGAEILSGKAPVSLGEAVMMPPLDVAKRAVNGLTNRQAQVLDVIRRSIVTRGYPPTLREIGGAMGIRSTNGVNDHLRALERKGYLTREDMTSRGLRLTEAKTRDEVDPEQAAQFLAVVVARATPNQAARIVRAAREALGLQVVS